MLAGLLLLGVAGCKTQLKPPTPVALLPPPAPTPLLVVVVPEIPAPVLPPAVPLPPPQTNAPVETWISWERWSLLNSAVKPRRCSPAAEHRYELRTTNGTISLSAGNRLAYWDGLACWLGFSPKLIQGQLYIHSLDAQKSLLPLLIPPPLLDKTNRILVLDPGHGGRSSGAPCIYNGHSEKEFTLDWALRIRRLLETNGWKVFLTRTNDQDLSLTQRVESTARCQAGLFVSLHFNSAYPYVDNAGMESYCLTPTGMPSSLTREFADDASQVFPNNAFDQPNLQYAASLQRALVLATGSQDRGVRRARFMAVLRGHKCPAVLLEGGYLSNPEEARLISIGAYRQRLAEAVARALRGKGED